MWKAFSNFYQRVATRKVFTGWSSGYEDEVAALAYSAPDKVAEAALRHLPDASIDDPPHIADIGIGTGLLAQQIYDAMPCLIAGLDFAEDMLAICAQKDITELLIKCDVGKDHWPLEEASYEAVIAAGLHEYLMQPMTQHFLQESARILKPDGLLVFSYIPSEAGQYQTFLWNGRNGRFLMCQYDPAHLEKQIVRHGFKILEHAAPFKGLTFRDGSTYSYRLIVAQKTN